MCYNNIVRVRQISLSCNRCCRLSAVCNGHLLHFFTAEMDKYGVRLIGLLAAEMVIHLMHEYTHCVCEKREVHSFHFSKAVVQWCRSTLLVTIVLVGFKSAFVLVKRKCNEWSMIINLQLTVELMWHFHITCPSWQFTSMVESQTPWLAFHFLKKCHENVF